MNAEWLLNWWNLIFLLPFGLALLYLGLYTVSGITFGDGDLDQDLDADHDFDADQDLDADHDVDTDHDAEMEGDHDASVDHDADDAGHGSLSLAALSWLGLGKVPLSIILMVLLLTWGVVGFIANTAMDSRGAAAALVSIPVAAAISLLVTHFVAAMIGRYLPLYETTAHRRHELLGKVGEAIFPIDQKFGMVAVRDETGDLYQIACRTESQGETIPKGSNVQLVAYNAKQGLFFVTRREVSSTPTA